MRSSRGYSPPRDRAPCLLPLPHWQADSLPLAPPIGMKVKRKVKVKSLKPVRFFAKTPRTVACQTPPRMGFSRQEYWNWLPFPSPGDSSRPKDRTLVSSTAGRLFTIWATRNAHYWNIHSQMKLLHSPAKRFHLPLSSFLLLPLTLSIQEQQGHDWLRRVPREDTCSQCHTRPLPWA